MEVSIKTPVSIKLWCDNQVALKIAPNMIFHEQTNHIEIDCHFVREKIVTKKIMPLLLIKA